MTNENREKVGDIVSEQTPDFWSVDSLGFIFGREAQELAAAHERGDAPFGKGLFLEKLWSAVDYTLREQSYSAPEEARKRMDELFLEVFHRSHPDLAKKIALVVELRDIADKYTHMRPEELPACIDGYAELNEKWALGELKKLKGSAPDFWVRRKKDFKPQFDIMSVPPWTARATLKDYQRLADSREGPKK